MEELSFNCVLVYAKNHRDCFIYKEDKKKFVKTEPIELFQIFDEFFIFSHKDENSNTNSGYLKFTDHLTGGLLGKFKNKEDLIQQIQDKVGKERYSETIRNTVKITGPSPSYRFTVK